MSAVVVTRPDTPRAEWLAKRRQGIGSSDIAGIIGVSPYASPLSLYHVKRGDLPEDDDRERFRMGRLLEDVIAGLHAERHPEHRITTCGMYAHADWPWQLATPDRLLLPIEGHPPVALLEAKTDAQGWLWGDDGTHDVPEYVRAQVTWQMDVLGVPRAWVGLLDGSFEYREYVVPYDAVYAKALRNAGEEFWRSVQDGQPPSIDGHGATTATLKALHPEVENRAVELDEDLASDYRTAVQDAREAEAAKDEATNRVLAVIGSARKASRDGHTVATRSVYEQRYPDLERLRAEHPDLLAQYKTTRTVRKLLPARARKDTA